MEKIRISGIIFEHGKNDCELWNNFVLSDEDENTIQNILSKYSTEGCSVRGTMEEIYEEDHAAWEDDSDRSCKDCPPDECTGHCMSCYYRTV